MKTALKRFTIYLVTIAMVIGLFQISTTTSNASSYLMQVITVEACSLWAQPNTSEANRVKVLPEGYLVKVYPNLVLSTKDDGKVFYRTTKGCYILTRCVQAVPKTRLTDGFVVTADAQSRATYQELQRQQDAIDFQELAGPYLSNPAAQELALEKKYGINISIPSSYTKDNATYAAYIAYVTEALSMISPEWVSLVAQLSKQKTGKKLTIAVKEFQGAYVAGSQADGLYYQDSNKIVLTSIDSFTLAHEIGHAFYYYCRAKAPKHSAKWTSFNAGIPYAGNNYYNIDFTYAMESVFVSDYAMQNENEDFAETCAYLFYGYTESLVSGKAASTPYLNQKIEYIRSLSNQFAGKRII